MIKQLAKSIREYKTPAIITLVLMVLEVAIEVTIPFITSSLINNIKAGIEMSSLIKTGLLLVLLACLSLCCGAAGGYTCSKASAGFAKNLRHDMYEKIQSFSFQNIDRFSSASLVTRMTTDVNNVQFSYMMAIRMAVRSPLMFVFAVIMAFIMGGKLAATFIIVIPVMVFGLIMIARKAMPAFHAVFKKYDKLN